MCVLAPMWLLARTILNFFHFEGVMMALGQTWFAHMQEPFTRILNLVLTQKWRSMLGTPRTRQTCPFGRVRKRHLHVQKTRSNSLFVTSYFISRPNRMPDSEQNQYFLDLKKNSDTCVLKKFFLLLVALSFIMSPSGKNVSCEESSIVGSLMTLCTHHL